MLWNLKKNKGKNKNKNEFGFYQWMKLRELENLRKKGDLGFWGVKGRKGGKGKGSFFWAFGFLAESGLLEQGGDCWFTGRSWEASAHTWVVAQPLRRAEELGLSGCVWPLCGSGGWGGRRVPLALAGRYRWAHWGRQAGAGAGAGAAEARKRRQAKRAKVWSWTK